MAVYKFTSSSVLRKWNFPIATLVSICCPQFCSQENDLYEKYSLHSFYYYYPFGIIYQYSKGLQLSEYYRWHDGIVCNGGFFGQQYLSSHG